MSYPCTGCGECCRHIENIPELAAYDNGQGVCIHLQDDNRCSIYDIRPPICSIDRVYELLYKNNMSKFDFYVVNKLACDDLQKAANLSLDYLVKL